MGDRRFRPWLLCGLFLLAVVTAAGLGGYAVIWPGTEVCGYPIGKMVPEQARKFLAGALEWSEREVVLSGGTQRLAVPWTDLGILPDIDATIDRCKRPLWTRLACREVPLITVPDGSSMMGFAEDLRSLWSRPASDARFSLVDGKVTVVPHEPGCEVDVTGFLSVLAGCTMLSAVPEEIEVPVVQVLPLVLTGELEKWLPMEEISSHTTFFAAGNDRAFNISLACEWLGTVTVWPGQVFSFNAATGPRSKERGYRMAGVFFGDDLIDDYGGGVCQVSTTLYIALLKAGLTVEERYNHGIPVSYVPLGMDATVVFDLLDLKIRNAQEFPVLISAKTQGGAITACVFGSRKDDLDIVIESRVLKEIPPEGTGEGLGSQPGGQTGQEFGEEPGQETPGQGSTVEERKLRSGYLVETVRKYIKDGTVIRVEKLGSSMYPPEKPKAAPAPKGS